MQIISKLTLRVTIYFICTDTNTHFNLKLNYIEKNDETYIYI